MDPFIGQIIMFGGNFAPRGWSFCDGQLLPISQYSALFSILGTYYGGDGRSTFALPDMRGRLSIHDGSGPGPGLSNFSLGQQGGNETTTLSINNLPSHSHTAVMNNTLGIGASTGTSDTDDPDGAVMGSGTQVFHSGAADVMMGATSIDGSFTVANANTGGSQGFSNKMPSLVVNYIIAMVGTYPSRN